MMMMMGDRQAGDCWIVGGDIPFYSQGLLLNLCVHFQQLCIPFDYQELFFYHFY
jgi:hypothetical protein